MPILLICLAVSTAAFAAQPKGKEASAETEPRSGADGLVNATQAQVKARFGEPDVARAEGAGAFWTYRLTDCALFVFFHKETKGLRVSSVTAGPLRRGDAAPDAGACVATSDADGLKRP
ncbi:MAG: hypothetical protein ABIO37_07795 [Caulobacteraceae bacterium]